MDIERGLKALTDWLAAQVDSTADELSVVGIDAACDEEAGPMVIVELSNGAMDGFAFELEPRESWRETRANLEAACAISVGAMLGVRYGCAYAWA